MKIEFYHSRHYDSEIYENPLVEEIVHLLINAADLSVFRLLIRLIVDLNLNKTMRTWQSATTEDVKSYFNHPDRRNIERAVSILAKIKNKFGENAGDYLAVIPPKYVLEYLQWRFAVKGMNDVCVRIEKKARGHVVVWDSGNIIGSNTVDAAVWADHKQEGACYECKLTVDIKKEQLAFLYTLWSESQECLEVGLASFASEAALDRCLLDFNVPESLKTLTRDRLYRYWRF